MGSKPSNNGQTGDSRASDAPKQSHFERGRTKTRLATPYGNPHADPHIPAPYPTCSALTNDYEDEQCGGSGIGRGGSGGRGGRKHHCHERIAAAFGKLINPWLQPHAVCIDVCVCVWRLGEFVSTG